jgi:hypothetical protein
VVPIATSEVIDADQATAKWWSVVLIRAVAVLSWPVAISANACAAWASISEPEGPYSS